MKNEDFQDHDKRFECLPILTPSLLHSKHNLLASAKAWTFDTLAIAFCNPLGYKKDNTNAATLDPEHYFQFPYPAVQNPNMCS